MNINESPSFPKINPEEDFMQTLATSEDMQASSILALFDTTKDQRSSFVMQIIDDVQEGRKEALDVHLQVKAMESVIDMLTNKKDHPTTAKAYSKMLLEAAEKRGREFQYHAGKFIIKEVGTVYDWSKCNDPELAELLQQEVDLKKKIKAKQDMLKTLPAKGILVTNEETGETYSIYPPAKSSSTAVSVTLK